MRYDNRPPHFYQDERFYFLTAKTVNSKAFFNSTRKKNIILSALNNALKEYQFGIFAWVILDNHYHCQIKVKQGTNLPYFVQKAHGLSARDLNSLEDIKGRKIWWNYWDKCLNVEKDFWVHFNYIHNNPLKHGYIKHFDELASYQFSSYQYYLKTKGQKWLDSVFEQYPVIDFTFPGD